MGNYVLNAPEIKRDDLMTVVAHALNLVDGFTRAERDRIRHAADVCNQIAYGEWVVENVGCPLAYAGISDRSDATDTFTQQYDQAVIELLRELDYDPDETPQVLTITDA